MYPIITAPGALDHATSSGSGSLYPQIPPTSPQSGSHANDNVPRMAAQQQQFVSEYVAPFRQQSYPSAMQPQQPYQSVLAQSNHLVHFSEPLLPLLEMQQPQLGPYPTPPHAQHSAPAVLQSHQQLPPYPASPQAQRQHTMPYQQQHQQQYFDPPRQCSAYPQLQPYYHHQQQQQQPRQLASYPQQQQHEPLLPYPAVPKPLPYTAPVDKVQYGYDVMVYINQAIKLPGMDWWNGLADPYIIITTIPPNAEQITYKTKTVWKSLNPIFDEFFELTNLPIGSTLMVEVWDKDMVTDDDIIGRSCWCFVPKELLPSTAAGGGMLGTDSSWGRVPVQVKLGHPRKSNKPMGVVELEVSFRPSQRCGPPAMMGPVRFRQHLSPAAGVLTGHWGNADTMCFSTYKLFLMHTSSIFKDVRCPWNKQYDKAVTIFKNPLMLSTVRTQHSSLYATHMGVTRFGVLTSPEDFFSLFKFGQRGGQRRYFTYTLLEESLRCSETGAAFFSDMMSKHAMHAGGEEEVLYAGEFCIVPDQAAVAGHKLVIDNNSGTYAPDKDKLCLMHDLFKANFPDMIVEVVAVGDEKLKFYQQQCPSRAGVQGKQPQQQKQQT